MEKPDSLVVRFNHLDPVRIDAHIPHELLQLLTGDKQLSLPILDDYVAKRDMKESFSGM